MKNVGLVYWLIRSQVMLFNVFNNTEKLRVVLLFGPDYRWLGAVLKKIENTVLLFSILYPGIPACVCQMCLLLPFTVCVNVQHDREVADIAVVFTEPRQRMLRPCSLYCRNSMQQNPIIFDKKKMLSLNIDGTCGHSSRSRDIAC